MTPDEASDRILAIEHEAKALRQLIEEHVRDEEAWRVGHDEKMDEIYNVLVGAKGAAKVLGWMIVALGATATAWTWVKANLIVAVR